jgi:Icc-related predicted phosphoesterase
VTDRTLFFATDIHGSEKCFRKFLNAGKYYGADTLILGGDLSGKLMVPVVKTGAGLYRATHLGHVLEVEDGTGLEGLLGSIRDAGYYPYVTDVDGVAELEADHDRQQRIFLDLRIATVERWVALAEERLRGSSTRITMMLGNDDDPELASPLAASDVIVDAEAGLADLGDGLTMLSVGFSNRTPWNSPRELDEDELYERICAQAPAGPALERCIFNIHVPPIDSGLDTAPRLDAALRPVTDLASGYVMFGAGSTATRRAIEETQPFIGLHGHIHESSGFAKLGRTSCFNPGSEYSSGTLRGVLLVIDREKGLRNHMLTTG